jgi:hypothetical protein
MRRSPGEIHSISLGQNGSLPTSGRKIILRSYRPVAAVICEHIGENRPNQSSRLKTPPDKSLHGRRIEFAMTSALYNADTRCFSRRRVYSKIKNPDSRQFAQHLVVAVVSRWIRDEVLAELFLGNHFANTGRAFLENHGLVVRAARLDMCCQREPRDGREDEDGASTGSHQTDVSISHLFVKAGPPPSRVRNNPRAESPGALPARSSPRMSLGDERGNEIDGAPPHVSHYRPLSDCNPGCD